jgi:hypothetical protein
MIVGAAMMTATSIIVAGVAAGAANRFVNRDAGGR